MTRGYRRLVFLGVLIVLLGGGLYAQMARQPVTAPLIGHLAPNFTLPALHGSPVTLSSLRGQPVYVNFWASWCIPCQQETPGIIQMYHQYGSRIAFVGVNATADDSAASARAFAKRFGIPYPVLLDTAGKAMSAYELIGMPASFFISAKGIIVARVVGAMTTTVMKQDFALLANSG